MSDWKLKVTACVELLEKPENSDLMFLIIHGFLNERGERDPDKSFLVDFPEMLKSLDRVNREISNYKGETLSNRWNKLLRRFDCDWTGFEEMIFCRDVQYQLYKFHLESMPHIGKSKQKQEEEELENLEKLIARLKEEWNL